MTKEGLQAPTETVRRRLSAQAVRDTKPELALRRELHRRGLRYRVNYPVPGKPRRTIDVAFPRRQLAVFVDGCFWHACPQHSVPSKSNTAWWQQKFDANARRDAQTTAFLQFNDWSVIRIWEHEIRDAPAQAVERVLVALSGR